MRGIPYLAAPATPLNIMNYKPLLEYAPKVAQRLSEHGPYDTMPLWDRFPSIIASLCSRIRSGDRQPSLKEVRDWMHELQDISDVLLPEVLRRRAEHDQPG